MRTSLPVLVAFALVVASPASAQEPTLVVENGRVITGDGTVLEEASVVVAGDRILEVTRESVEAPDARRIDASGKTVLPGLIDAHVHLTIPPDGRDSVAVARHMEENVPGILHSFLEHGVTTVRSTGEYWPAGRELRGRLASGELKGPRMITPGPTLTAEDGHPVSTICAGGFSGVDLDRPDSFCRSRLAEVVSEPEEARAAVQRLAEEGVDFIKLISDSVNAPVQIKDEVVEAVVEQARREGLRAVGHVYDGEHMARYAEMGLDGFVHLVYPATIPGENMEQFGQQLAKQGTPVTTTLSAILLFAPGGVSGKQIEAVLEGESSAREVVESVAQEAAAFDEAGVTVVVGTDWWGGAATIDHPAVQPGALTITEMKMLRWGGMSRHAILQAATSNAARALEMGDEVGTLEADKLADLIVVDGNPLEDLSALEEVEVVVKGGTTVSDSEMER